MTAGLVFWFTGLSGAGKSQIASRVAPRLEAAGRSVLTLDGDDLRATLSRDLGFSRADIMENNRRIAHHCAKVRHQADVVLVPLISPLADGRAVARSLLAPGFFEVWIAAGLDTVIARDPKGLYARARAGEIPDMIGYAPGNPYEPPLTPDLTIDSAGEPPEQSANKLFAFVMAQFESRLGS
jgi:adenylyl-sulfate kinase